MRVHVNRIALRINPDYKKVIARFFNTGNERSQKLIDRVIKMPQKDADHLIQQVLEEFSPRYKDIQAIFVRHFELTKHLLRESVRSGLSLEKILLIGSYFTMEYSIEAAALFNPSIVEDPDQSGAQAGEKKVIISFRATGESHISSLVFKRATLDAQSMIHFEPSGKFNSEGEVTEQKDGNKMTFKDLMSQVALPDGIRSALLNSLHDPFSYKEMEAALKSVLLLIDSFSERKKVKYDILSVVNTSYELQFPADSDLSERVIFPVTFAEKNGIEDARFVKFTDEDDSVTYIATYTAYDGSFILPQLIETKDFLDFKVSPLHGKGAINKNLALFPRKINGHYVMLARIDGFTNYIMFSDDLYLWEEVQPLQEPEYPWEYVQIGNGGSPIETDRGWLVITHGVGPMRKYCLGASLFDLQDPRIELGRLSEPLLMPNEDERHGYVPNVVYSCGSMIHGDDLFIPYAVSDHACSFATVPLNGLLDEILAVS